MNWLTDYVRPKLTNLFGKREMPENLWRKCDECGQMIFHRELAEALFVCNNCDHHMQISPRDRFAALFDGGHY
ncbi:MAG: acetyl-CoA carboxylase carboxyl transferase subunit beta, partial [Rubrimonas sp.]